MKGVPAAVDVEYLPCVATFDSYDDERTGGARGVRYLARLEYHGPNGLLVKGKSLAPFFDDDIIDHPDGNDDDGRGAKKSSNPSFFPGIAAVAIGCGIEGDDDADRIRSFFEALSSCCTTTDAQKITSDRGGRSGGVVTTIQCLQPNAGYASMKEENEAYRQFNDDEREEAVSNGTLFGPGKMVAFVREVARGAIRQRWDEEFTEYERKLHILPEEAQQQTYFTNEGTSLSADDVTADDVTMPREEVAQCTATQHHTPNIEHTRYACKICRTPLFGEEDLEDPPHGQLLHNFRKNKKMYKVGYGGGGGYAGPCQNHFIARPLAWMDDGGCCAGGMEGKLHCPKCKAKVGHYSWTGAQCSCGTWVTPAIMVPLSRVDEMRPPPTSSQDAGTTMVTTGSSSGVDHCNTAVGLMSLGVEEPLSRIL